MASYKITDLDLTISRALPAQNTTAYSSAIDLMATSPERIGALTDLYIKVPATTCATGQTITLTVQDSADNSSFAAVTGVATLVLTGASNVTAETERTIKLPPGVRRYVRVSIAMSATTGDQTAITATIHLRS